MALVTLLRNWSKVHVVAPKAHTTVCGRGKDGWNGAHYNSDGNVDMCKRCTGHCSHCGGKDADAECWYCQAPIHSGCAGEYPVCPDHK
jgi:hypothetical protein